MNIRELAAALNSAAEGHDIGQLQELRVRIRSLRQRPSKSLFDGRTTFDNYAFHVGGRSELQFNIGLEEGEAEPWIRFGVAFSLELSQSLPTIAPLLPKIARFNDYVRSHPEDMVGMSMWHFDHACRSVDRSVGPIDDELARIGVFIAIGRREAASAVRVEDVLDDFDRLLPLYRYVEAADLLRPVNLSPPFRAGCPSFVLTARRDHPAVAIDVALRHKELQLVVYDRLCEDVGKDNVSMEHSLDLGWRVDTVVRQPDGDTYYELKVAANAQACIRMAIGQLFEYSYWPSEERAKDLVILGEHALDQAGEAYMALLRTRFNLPLWYRQVDLARRTIGARF